MPIATSDQRTRTISVVERRSIPYLSVVLGFGPVLVIALRAPAASLSTGPLQQEIITGETLWAGAILAFLAGVRRGLSFWSEGGPSPTQILAMAGLFVLALAFLSALLERATGVAIACEIAGYASLIILDPIAARNGERAPIMSYDAILPFMVYNIYLTTSVIAIITST